MPPATPARCPRWTAFLSGALAMLATPALAEEAWRLTWDAPAACPSGTEVRARVLRLLPRQATRGQGVVATARVTAPSAPGTRWHLHLTVSGPHGAGVRELQGDACETLTDAAALIVALAIDPQAGPAAVIDPPEPTPRERPRPARRPDPPPPAPLPAPPPAPPTPPPAPEAPPPPARPASPWWVIQAGGVGDLGLLPDTGLGVRAAVGVGLRRWHVGVSGRWLGPRETLREDGSGGRFSAIGAGARVCRAFLPGALSLDVCGGLDTARARGAGIGVQEPQSGHALWVAPAAGLSARWPARARVAVSLGAGLWYSLLRPRFFIEDVGLVHRVAGPGASASLGLDLRWGFAAAVDDENLRSRP